MRRLEKATKSRRRILFARTCTSCGHCGKHAHSDLLPTTGLVLSSELETRMRRLTPRCIACIAPIQLRETMLHVMDDDDDDDTLNANMRVGVCLCASLRSLAPVHLAQRWPANNQHVLSARAHIAHKSALMIYEIGDNLLRVIATHKHSRWSRARALARKFFVVLFPTLLCDLARWGFIDLAPAVTRAYACSNVSRYV